MGAIKGNSQVGGILGNTNRNGFSMSANVALNPDVNSIWGGIDGYGRIAFNTNTMTSMSSLYARNDMTFTLAGVTSLATSGTTGNLNGANVSAGPAGYNGQAFWSGLGWDFTQGTGVWEWSAAKQLPILRGLGGQ